jgi:hypothetical protein
MFRPRYRLCVWRRQNFDTPSLKSGGKRVVAVLQADSTMIEAASREDTFVGAWNAV